MWHSGERYIKKRSKVRTPTREGDYMRAAVYAGTRNVYENMIPAAKSLLYNSNVEKVYFLIEDDVFPYELPQEVECININNYHWFDAETCPNYHEYWTMMPLYRVAYSKIFPHLDTILSLDNDTIVNKSISELWDIDMTNYYVAGVRDTVGMNSKGFYINAGVVLHNLKRIREEKKDDEAIHILNTIRKDFPEQDVFNELYKGHILELPTEYNSSDRFMNYNPNKRKIIHFVGDRNFPNYYLVKKYRDITLTRPWERPQIRKVAVYCGTRNLYQDMLTAAKSLLVNSSVERIYFIIEDEKFPYLLPSCIKTICVKDQNFFRPDGPNYNSKWTYMILMRAALTKLLPQEDLVLSLDVDTIVDKNVDDLWDYYCMDNYYMGGVREPWKSSGSYLYVNIGVCLFNLKLLRETKKDEEIIYALNNFKYNYPEQECYNDKCQGKILELPSEYNSCIVTRKTDEKRIIHFAATTDWQDNYLVQRYKHKPLATLKKEKRF